MIKKIATIFSKIILYTSLLSLTPHVFAAIIDIPAGTSEDTDRYLGILLNRTYGIDQNARNIPNIQDANRNDENRNNLHRGLIFLNPRENNYVYANAAMNIPWWYNPDLDIIPVVQDHRTSRNNLSFPANPTVQSMVNSISTIYGVECEDNFSMNDDDCIQPNYQQNIVAMMFDKEGNLDRQKLSQLSISSLIDPLQYDEEGVASQQDAENFIRLISAGMLSLQLDSQYKTVSERAQGRGLSGNARSRQETMEINQTLLAAYNSQILGHVSRSSVVMDNLYYLMSRRMPNRETQKSVNQAEYEMVERRIKPDSDWRRNLNNQSLNATMRDIAELLAEQQYQSYLRGQENEHLIATLSALVIAQQEFLKMNYYLQTEDEFNL